MSYRGAKPISQNLSWLELFLDAAVKFNNGEFAYVAHLLIEQLSLAFEPENTIHKSTDIWSSVLAQRFISADFLNSNKLSVLEQKFLHARYQFSEENNSHLKLLKSEPLPIAAKKAEIEFKQAVVLDELVRQCLLSEATICDDERDDNVYSASEEQFQLRLKYLRLLLVYGRRFNREEFLCVAKENILLYLQEPQPFKVASNSLEVSVGIITLLSEFLAFEDNHKAFQSIIEICDNDSIGDIKVDSADIGNKTSTHGLIKCFWYLQILACLKKKRADESFSTLGEKKLGELIENRLSKKGSLPATVLLKQNVGMWLLNGTITATLPLQEKCFRGYQPFRLSHYTSSLTSEIEFETGENVVLTIVNSLGDERSFTSVSDAL